MTPRVKLVTKLIPRLHSKGAEKKAEENDDKQMPTLLYSKRAKKKKKKKEKEKRKKEKKRKENCRKLACVVLGRHLSQTNTYTTITSRTRQKTKITCKSVLTPPSLKKSDIKSKTRVYGIRMKIRLK